MILSALILLESISLEFVLMLEMCSCRIQTSEAWEITIEEEEGVNIGRAFLSCEDALPSQWADAVLDIQVKVDAKGYQYLSCAESCVSRKAIHEHNIVLFDLMLVGAKGGSPETKTVAALFMRPTNCGQVWWSCGALWEKLGLKVEKKQKNGTSSD